MNWKIFFISLTGAALLTSCQTARQATPSSMIEGEWNITEVNGSAIKAQSSPYIGFDTTEKRVYGNFGCNRVSGSFDFNGKNDQIEFGQMLSTMMACPDMELEQSILRELNSVECIIFSDNEHPALCDKNRKPLIQMERRFHTVPLSEIEGKWRIVSVFGETMPVSDETPYVNFDTENSCLSAFAGCNNLSGNLKSGEKNTIIISNVASTMMACPDMSTEENVFTALEQVSGFGISPDESLLLFSDGGNVVMVLKR